MSNYRKYAPWYVCIWRAIWFVPLVLSVCLYTFMILMVYGPREAKHVWRELI